MSRGMPLSIVLKPCGEIDCNCQGLGIVTLLVMMILS